MNVHSYAAASTMPMGALAYDEQQSALMAERDAERAECARRAVREISMMPESEYERLMDGATSTTMRGYRIADWMRARTAVLLAECRAARKATEGQTNDTRSAISLTAGIALLYSEGNTPITEGPMSAEEEAVLAAIRAIVNDDAMPDNNHRH